QDVMPVSVWSEKPYEEWEAGYKDIMHGRSKIENHYFCLIEDQDQKILGFGVAGYVYPESRHNLPLHWIHEIFLDPDQTGNGYGKHIMNAMAQYMLDDDAKICGLCVGKTNKRAQKFYEDTGAKILRDFDDNIVHGYKVPAHIYQWDDVELLYKNTKSD
ncbi:MAG: GNAT family N-acetyltransferase, partial [Pseudomonadota bacterium]